MLAVHLPLELDAERLSLGTSLVFHRMLHKIGIVDQDALQQNGGFGPALRDSLSQFSLWQRAVPLLATVLAYQLLATWRTQLAGKISGRSISTWVRYGNSHNSQVPHAYSRTFGACVRAMFSDTAVHKSHSVRAYKMQYTLGPRFIKTTIVYTQA